MIQFVNSIIVALIFVTAAGNAFGQAVSGPSFEVASVKRTDPQTRLIGMFVDRGGRVTITNYTLKLLIQDAYGVQDFQITGGPKWTAEALFSIVAIPPASSSSSHFVPISRKRPPPDEELMMLRSLMAERFHLTLHQERKEGRIFALQLDKSGPKLSAPKNISAFPFVGFGPNLIDHQADFVEMRGENASMDKLAVRLSQELEVPVRNETGLAGSFDFHFAYVRQLSASVGPSLFTAIRDIGLRLVPARGTVMTLVIDRAQIPSD
jgi:uncharacterized protein (TIGR03435 family)